METVQTTNLFNDEDERKVLGKAIASGLIILDYWANFEECSVDAEVRTVDFATRLYLPYGSGESVDLYWYCHCRARYTIEDENQFTADHWKSAIRTGQRIAN